MDRFRSILVELHTWTGRACAIHRNPSRRGIAKLAIAFDAVAYQFDNIGIAQAAGDAFAEHGRKSVVHADASIAMIVPGGIIEGKRGLVVPKGNLIGAVDTVRQLSNCSRPRLPGARPAQSCAGDPQPRRVRA